MFITKPASGDPLASAFPNTNHDHDSSLAWSIALTNGLFIALVVCVVGARMFTRAFKTKQVFADDYIMLSASFFFLLQCSINLAAMDFGFGEHVWNSPGSLESERIRSTQRVGEMNFVSLIFLSICLCMAKVSVITTLLYVFTPQTVKILRNILLATKFVVIACGVIQTSMIIFQCYPIRLNWIISEIGKEGSCMSVEGIVVGSGTVNFVTDIIITVAPVRYFLGLNMPRRQKLGLCALFVSGFIACIISLFRIAATRGVENNYDVTYATVPYFNWSVAETGLCIITGSIPPLRPLIATIIPDFCAIIVPDLFRTTTLPSRAVSSKGSSVRRPSFSRVSSRQSSGDDTPPLQSPRLHSDAASITPPANALVRAGRGPLTEKPLPEPPNLGARAADLVRRWCPVLLATTKRGLFRLGERIPRAVSRTDISRPLSVINELDETTDVEAHRRRTETIGQNGFEYVVMKMLNVSTRLQNAKWKASIWRYHRSHSTPSESGPVGSPGSIIVIKEIVTHSERRTA